MGNDNVKDYPPYLDYPKPRKPQANADEIRAMSDEELAAEMTAKGGCPHDCETPDDMGTDCYKCWLDWLRQEAQDG